MASSDTDQATEATPGESGGSGGIGRMLLQGLGIFLIVLAANVTTGLLIDSPSAESATSEVGADGEQAVDLADLPPPIYISLGEPMVVNFDDGGRLRFLQLGVDVMGRDKDTVAGVEKNLPIIRNNLLMLFGSFNYQSLITIEGKEKMRGEALAEVRAVLQRITGEPSVEDLYFTSFVIQ